MEGSRAVHKKVVFVHVAKTGGSTFRRILEEVYGDAFRQCDARTIEGIEATFAKYDAVELHATNTTTQWFRPLSEIVRLGRWNLLEDTEIFTMLRDPVDRYISNYHYMVSHREFAEAAMAHHGFKFPESLEEIASWPTSYDFQIEFLLGKMPRNAREAIPITREDLEELKKGLVRMNVHVGLTERFAESVHVFESITGRQVPGKLILNVNRTPNRPRLEAIPEELRNLIRQRSALEVELYDFGRELFLADLVHSGPIREFRFEEETPTLGVAIPESSADPLSLSLWSRFRIALLPGARR